MKPEKQAAILDAAFAEFGHAGYKKASTNRIVRAAGISKGMLFYYFNSKQELFGDLVRHGLTLYRDVYLSQPATEETDFIERYKHVSVLKLRASMAHPRIFTFFGNLYLHEDTAYLPPDLQNLFSHLQQEILGDLYTNVDTSKFRDDLPPQRTIQLIRWCMDGYSQDLIRRLRHDASPPADYAPYWEEFYALLDTLRTLFYR